MPLENRLSPNFDATHGVASGIASLGQAAMQAPLIRARGALMQANTGRAQSQMALALARAGLVNTQQQGAQSQQDALKALGDELQGATTSDGQGRVTIDLKKAPNVAKWLVQSSKGGNDTALSIKNFMGGANAAPEADLDRANKVAVAQVKPIILKPGESAYSNNSSSAVDNSPSPSDIDNPDASGAGGLVQRLIASAPAAPAKALPPDTQTIRQDVNPAYKDNTNLPPFINLTNTTRRIASGAPVNAPTAQKPLPDDVALKYLQQSGGDKQKARQAAAADGYSF